MSDKRLIDANALKKAFSTDMRIVLFDGTRMGAGGFLIQRYQVVGLIGEAPTIDAVPVVHGRWVMMAGFPACSKCGCSPADWEAKPDNPEGYPPYCHSCGAKMDGGAEDANS